MIDTVNIGGVSLKKTAALAPMAGVADYAYRIMCREFGASYMVSEMVSAKGTCYSDRKTAELCTVTDGERPMAVQLFGSEPDFMAKAVEIVLQYEPDIIDINNPFATIIKQVYDKSVVEIDGKQIKTPFIIII